MKNVKDTFKDYIDKIKEYILENKLATALVAACVVVWVIWIGGMIIDDYSSSDHDDYNANNNYVAPSENYNSSKVKCGHSSCAQNGPFYCIGKNDTCNNRTYCAYDLYCDQCSSKNNSSKVKCGHSSCAQNGPFYCIGKNDTCNNRTYCAYDLYCDECD